MLDSRLEKWYRLTYQEREDIIFEKQKERRELKEKIHRGWLSESERVDGYKRVKQLNRDLWIIFKLNEAEETTFIGQYKNLGRAVERLGEDILEVFKPILTPIINFINKIFKL